MKFLWLNIICVIFITTLLNMKCVNATSSKDYPGAIELVGYNNNPAGNRRSRMSRYNPSDSSDQQVRQYRQFSSLHAIPPTQKEQADIETVKSNIDEYNRLLKVDTKKLTDQQKDMLERIVERVARLKESYDIDVEQENVPTNATKDESQNEEPPKETTLSSDDTITTIQSTTPLPTTVATTTSDAIASQARSASDSNKSGNNKNSSTRNISSNSGSSNNKSRVRQNSTKRPSSSTKASAKRTTSHRHPTKSSTISYTMSSSAATPSSTVSSSNSNSKSHNSTSTTNLSNGGNSNVGQQKVIPATTIQPRVKASLSQQSYGNQQESLHDVLIKQQHHLQHHHGYHGSSVDDIAMEQKTIPNAGYGGGPSSLIYDTNATASSIIDSLSNHGRDEYYTRGPHSDINKEKKTTATMKPTKYHFYPHNQHIYLLPECAIQQVCNAVYVRLNYTQPLCACPSRYRDPCSASLSEDDEHTTKLVGDSSKKAITLAKTCESTTEMRECRTPKDWSLLALQNTRTGKSHYLVICRCPDHFKLEGPMAHDQPTYASVPGIRVFGMMCVKPGYSFRKPSVQPPKRYQLQKPYYVPTSNKYSSIKDNRPSYGQQDSYQNQYQANYQYLSRPDNTPIHTSNTEYPDSISLNTFGGGVYGRNNIRKGETVAAEDETTAATDNTTAKSNDNNNNNSNSSDSSNNSNSNNDKENNKREKRDATNEDYYINTDDADVPEFPWHRLEELRRTVLWD